MSNTKSLEDFVLKHRLFFTLQDDHAPEAEPRNLSNFAVCVIPANSHRVVIHGEEFGDSEFYRTMHSLPESEKKVYFYKHCQSSALELIEKEISASLQNTAHLRTGDIRPMIGEKARDLAWRAFGEITDPYSTRFTHAKYNASNLLARYANPTALMLALDGPNPYNIFICQDDSTSPFNRLYSRKEGIDTRVSTGTADIDLQSILISTGKYYPLGVPKDTVKTYLNQLQDSYEATVAATIRHEFAHLILEYENDKYIESHQIEATHLLWEEANKVSYKYVQMILRASTMPSGKTISSDPELAEYFYLCGSDSKSITGKDAVDYLKQDIKAIATTLSPSVDFRKLSVVKFLDQKTQEQMERTFRFYRKNERIAETHSRLHELTLLLPIELLDRLFPICMKKMTSDVQDMQLYYTPHLDSVDRLAQGKPILIQGPERFIKSHERGDRSK
jgi:hypothetical protein